MKRTFFISLLNSMILFSLLISFMVAGCGKSKDEIKKDATEIVSNYKLEVEKFEGWVQNKADFENPVIENQYVGFNAKIDTVMSKWNLNKDMFKQKIQAEEFSKLESEIKAAELKVLGIEELFKKKLALVQGESQSYPEQQAEDEE